jgi:hypothetical protein
VTSMICPVCEDKDAVFEAASPVTITPVLEKWRFDEGSAQLLRTPELWKCVGCGAKCRIHLNQQIIVPVPDSVPVFDDTVDRILKSAKEDRDDVIPDGAIKRLKDRGYRGFNATNVGADVVRIILTQMED